MTEQPDRKSVHLDPALHMEIKAYSDFSGRSIKETISRLLRQSLDDIEVKSEQGINADLDNTSS
jgi:hypothetical protein